VLLDEHLHRVLGSFWGVAHGLGRGALQQDGAERNELAGQGLQLLPVGVVLRRPLEPGHALRTAHDREIGLNPLLRGRDASARPGKRLQERHVDVGDPVPCCHGDGVSHLLVSSDGGLEPQAPVPILARDVIALRPIGDKGTEQVERRTIRIVLVDKAGVPGAQLAAGELPDFVRAVIGQDRGMILGHAQYKGHRVEHEALESIRASQPVVQELLHPHALVSESETSQELHVHEPMVLAGVEIVQDHPAARFLGLGQCVLQSLARILPADHAVEACVCNLAHVLDRHAVKADREEGLAVDQDDQVLAVGLHFPYALGGRRFLAQRGDALDHGPARGVHDPQEHGVLSQRDVLERLRDDRLRVLHRGLRLDGRPARRTDLHLRGQLGIGLRIGQREDAPGRLLGRVVVAVQVQEGVVRPEGRGHGEHQAGEGQDPGAQGSMHMCRLHIRSSFHEKVTGDRSDVCATLVVPPRTRPLSG